LGGVGKDFTYCAREIPCSELTGEPGGDVAAGVDRDSHSLRAIQT
jgi:hypothetical protein